MKLTQEEAEQVFDDIQHLSIDVMLYLADIARQRRLVVDCLPMAIAAALPAAVAALKKQGPIQPAAVSFIRHFIDDALKELE